MFAVGGTRRDLCRNERSGSRAGGGGTGAAMAGATAAGAAGGFGLEQFFDLLRKHGEQYHDFVIGGPPFGRRIVCGYFSRPGSRISAGRPVMGCLPGLLHHLGEHSGD